MGPLKVGNVIRRVRDGRVFRIIMINHKARAGGVFSAASADGHWEDWGGSIDQLIYPETFTIETL